MSLSVTGSWIEGTRITRAQHRPIQPSDPPPEETSEQAKTLEENDPEDMFFLAG